MSSWFIFSSISTLSRTTVTSSSVTVRSRAVPVMLSQRQALGGALLITVRFLCSAPRPCSYRLGLPGDWMCQCSAASCLAVTSLWYSGSQRKQGNVCLVALKFPGLLLVPVSAGKHTLQVPALNWLKHSLWKAGTSMLFPEKLCLLASSTVLWEALLLRLMALLPTEHLPLTEVGQFLLSSGDYNFAQNQV